MVSERRIGIAMETSSRSVVGSRVRDKATWIGVRCEVISVHGMMIWTCCLQGRQGAKSEMKHRCAVWSIC